MIVARKVRMANVDSMHSCAWLCRVSPSQPYIAKAPIPTPLRPRNVELHSLPEALKGVWWAMVGDKLDTNLVRKKSHRLI